MDYDADGLADPTIFKLTCPRCQSRLDIVETSSGGRTTSVAGLGVSVEHSARALEHFQGPDEGPDIRCPACETMIDPAAPYRVRLDRNNRGG